MPSAVCGDGEAVQWRRVRRWDRLVWLRIPQWIYSGKVIGNLLSGRRLEKDVWVLPALERRRERVCRLVEGFGGDD
jgi:hypothetical protein